jgi:type I restriction enzyme R subunit
MESTGRSACATVLATNPALRNKLIELKKSYEQTIDTVTKDEVLEAGFSAAAKDKARSVVESFEKFIQEHKDEITALQILYSRPYSQRLTLKGIKDLASSIEKPPRGWTPQVLWRAYETLEKSKVRGAGGKVLADIVSLVRFALHQDNELRPFHDQVNERFAQWIAQQEKKGRKFTDEQRHWLDAIRDHIAASFAIEMEDFDYVPFMQRGGLGKVNQVFGAQLTGLLNELNEVLAA